MPFMPNGRVRVKSQCKQLCVFAWAETQPAPSTPIDPLDPQEVQVERLSRKTGWSAPYARAVIEANGGRIHV